MQSCALPTICLGPTGNFQGSYHFLNLVSSLVIKWCAFTKLPAPQSVIHRVSELAATSGVSRDLIFADWHCVPFTWATDGESNPPPLPVAPYPDIPAEIPGVLLEQHTGMPPTSTPHSHEPDWVQMADDAVDNAAFESTDLLPPPPEVISIDNKVIPDVPSTSQLTLPPKFEPTPTLLPEVVSNTPEVPTRYPSRKRRPPQHLQDYVFTTVAEEHNQRHDHPYTNAYGSTVDLAIKDEYMMAQVCHYVMTHTANSLYCATDIKQKKPIQS
jgi:hypothetical protein